MVPGMDHRTFHLDRRFVSDSLVGLVGVGRRGALTGTGGLLCSIVFQFSLVTQSSFMATVGHIELAQALEVDLVSIGLVETVEGLAVLAEVDLVGSAIIANFEE